MNDINIINLKEASEQTADYSMNESGHNEVFFNMRTGKITVIHNGDDNSYHTCGDDEVKVCDSRKHMEPSEIEYLIKQAVDAHEQMQMGW